MSAFTSTGTLFLSSERYREMEFSPLKSLLLGIFGTKRWGTDVYVVARTVDVHIRKVREKIGEEHIKTIKGVGYKFNTD